MYNVFDDKDDTTATDPTTTNIAALIPGNTITGGQIAATLQELAVQAINQPSAIQTAMMNQMAAISFNNTST